MASISALSLFLIFFISSVLLTQSQAPPPVTQGLSFTFYDSKCPKLESIIRKFLKKAFKKDIGLAAGLLRVHFHDCFVQGCDGSVLLDGSASGPSEQDAPPNLTLRPSAFKAINDLRAAIDDKCGQVVSCADVAALAARDSVFLSGGPDYEVPLGRRDGQSFATRDATIAALPAPTSNVTVLLNALSKLKLNAEDLVALSGGHTIGIGHCSSFSNRLYPSRDSTMDQTFAKNLYSTCPTSTSSNTTVLDLRSPNAFDNKYYVDLMNRQGVFTSDQDLYSDGRTREIVKKFAVDEKVFFERFAASMVKMGQLSVLTGKQGEIRANCSARNARKVVDGDGDDDVDDEQRISSIVDEDDDELVQSLAAFD